MPGHDHDLVDHHADKWTNIATVGELIASFVSDTYWLATLFDIAGSLESEALGLSYYGMIFGVVSALLSAGGAAYSHRSLNKFHQPDAKSSDGVEQGNIQNHATEISSLVAKPNLTILQKIALTGDFISHVGDIAGPMTFVGELASHNGLPRWGKLIVQCGATLFGGLASVANVRSCKDAIIKNNQAAAQQSGEYKFTL